MSESGIGIVPRGMGSTSPVWLRRRRRPTACGQHDETSRPGNANATPHKDAMGKLQSGYKENVRSEGLFDFGFANAVRVTALFARRGLLQLAGDVLERSFQAIRHAARWISNAPSALLARADIHACLLIGIHDLVLAGPHHDGTTEIADERNRTTDDGERPEDRASQHVKVPAARTP